MKEDYVSLEVAKLLKEKGFTWCCDFYYDPGNKNTLFFLPGISNDSLSKGLSVVYVAPTLYVAQKWLREKINIHITIDNSASGYYFILYKTNGTFIKGSIYSGPNDGGVWNTYEEALSNAIFESLKF